VGGRVDRVELRAVGAQGRGEAMDTIDMSGYYTIKCDGCGELIEIPVELVGDGAYVNPDTWLLELSEPYYCGACDDE